MALNQPVLRNVIPSYAHQLEKAVRRRDRVHISHLTTAMLASYFDMIFALSRVLHPGEKRQLAFALQHCPTLPAGMAAEVDEVLGAAGTGSGELFPAVNTLVDHLDQVLAREGFETRVWL